MIFSTWKVVATDGSWETFYQWRRVPSIALAESEAILQWTIPSDATVGSYRYRLFVCLFVSHVIRITHYGDKKQFLTGKISPFTAQSAIFKVNA